MNKKWNVQNKKGYLKIHVAVNIKTKEILALEVTDEKIHDSRTLKKLVNHVLKIIPDDKNKVKKIKSILADGSVHLRKQFTF
jgi:hypothetical protein